MIDWLCFRLYLILPVDSRLAWAVLPRAGRYAWRGVEVADGVGDAPW